MREYALNKLHNCSNYSNYFNDHNLQRHTLQSIAFIIHKCIQLL